MAPDGPSLAEVAMLAGGTVLLAVLGAVMPHLLLVAPVPLGVLTYRQGLRVGIGTALFASALAGLLFVNPAVWVLVLLVLGMGLTLGGALREPFSAGQVLAFGTAAGIITVLLLLGATHAVARLSPGQLMADAIRSSVEELARRWTETGAGPTGTAELQRLEQSLLRMVRLEWPGWLFVSSLTTAFGQYGLIRLLLRRSRVQVAWFPPFRSWRFPWWTAWGYIAGRGLMLLDHFLPMAPLHVLGANLELAFGYLFLVQGLAVAWFYLERLPWRWVGYLIAVFLLQLPAILILAGVLDTWFNFRRLPAQPADKAHGPDKEGHF